MPIPWVLCKPGFHYSVMPGASTWAFPVIPPIHNCSHQGDNHQGWNGLMLRCTSWHCSTFNIIEDTPPRLVYRSWARYPKKIDEHKRHTQGWKQVIIRVRDHNTGTMCCKREMLFCETLWSMLYYFHIKQNSVNCPLLCPAGLANENSIQTLNVLDLVHWHTYRINSQLINENGRSLSRGWMQRKLVLPMHTILCWGCQMLSEATTCE